MKFNAKDLEAIYQKLTGVVKVQATFVTEFVGGQPADERGVRAFVEHHLELTGDDAEKAVQRILHEEVGQEELPSETGELQPEQVYGVNALRRTERGAYIGNWMVQACIKQAASRLKIFSDLRGTKGDFSEAARVLADGFSLLDADSPDKVYMLNEDMTGPAKTYWSAFMGSVNTPKGPKSIYQHSECVASGSRFSFNFRFLTTNVKEVDLTDVTAMIMMCGLGSCRSLGRGRFRVDEAEIEMGDRQKKREKPVIEAPAKANGAETAKAATA